MKNCFKDTHINQIHEHLTNNNITCTYSNVLFVNTFQFKQICNVPIIKV